MIVGVYLASVDWLIVVVQSLSGIQLFVTPWTTAHQASLSFTIYRSLLKFVSTEIFISCSVAPFSFCLQSFPVLESFPMSWLFASGSQITGASTSVSVLPMNIQGWFPLGLTGWSSCCPRDSLMSILISKTQFSRRVFHSYYKEKEPLGTGEWNVASILLTFGCPH